VTYRKVAFNNHFGIILTLFRRYCDLLFYSTDLFATNSVKIALWNKAR